MDLEQEKELGQDSVQEEKKTDTLEQEIEQNLYKDVESEIVSQKGVIADKFDYAPAVPISKEEKNEFENKDSVQVTYGFTAQEVEKALKVFQRQTIYKKNIIYSLIIAVLFFSYLYQIVRQSQTQFSTFMCVITVAVLGLIWYFPWNHIKSMVKAISNQEYKEDYILIVYDDAIAVGDLEDGNVFYYHDNKIKVWELSDMFVVGYNKQRIFVVPKRCCNDQVQKMSDLFREGLQQNYKLLS